jgi:hypothetical protein
MVRRRFFSAVSNHEARGPSFETRAKSALLGVRLEIASRPLRMTPGSRHVLIEDLHCVFEVDRDQL